MATTQLKAYCLSYLCFTEAEVLPVLKGDTKFFCVTLIFATIMKKSNSIHDVIMQTLLWGQSVHSELLIDATNLTFKGTVSLHSQ